MSAADDATFIETDDGATLQAAMERELEQNWQLIRECLGEAVPRNVLEIARSSYWIGVRTGVRVNTNAVSRAYQ